MSKENSENSDLFNLEEKIVCLTGGAGLLGSTFADVIMRYGGRVCVIDSDIDKLSSMQKSFEHWGSQITFEYADVTDEKSVRAALSEFREKIGNPNCLINNAAHNPVVTTGRQKELNHLADFDVSRWNDELGVGLTGSFICSKVFGDFFYSKEGGVIINIASDLGVMAPNHSIYNVDGTTFEKSWVKPVTYSVVKFGLIGLTKYLSTYWPNGIVRSNALAPGGVEVTQSEHFLKSIKTLIPMSRMAGLNEYQGVLVFMLSKAANYMNGAVVNVDGGRTAW